MDIVSPTVSIQIQNSTFVIDTHCPGRQTFIFELLSSLKVSTLLAAEMPFENHFVESEMSL